MSREPRRASTAEDSPLETPATDWLGNADQETGTGRTSFRGFLERQPLIPIH
ncbi:MAG: hypothetical protein QNJ55_23340 [Xenococcus sp. MO_188.B8]|nr:hypothetical protein [Xenococcus sp. MO_188.B8]